MGARPRQGPIEDPEDDHKDQPKQAMQRDSEYFIADIQVSFHAASLHWEHKTRIMQKRLFAWEHLSSSMCHFDTIH